MLSPDENPGIFYFLVGMIVLVMTAVGMSLMMDRRFKFSSGIEEIKRDISLQGMEVADLRARKERLSAELLEEQSRRSPASSGRRELQDKVATLTRRKTEFTEARNQLREAIPAMESAFADYRANYRRKTWAKAVGQDLGTLTVRGGREYRQVLITKVTDVGLEIRHEHGIARVQAPDLSAEFQDRFQWSDEERRARLKAESASFDPKPPETVDEGLEEPLPDTLLEAPQPRTIPAVRDEDPAAQEENLRLLRTRIVAWKAKISRLQSEQSEASSNASYGKQTSVPGSLETWKAKAARLSRELSRARTELSVEKSKLAAIAPGDPLLRPVTGESY